MNPYESHFMRHLFSFMHRWSSAALLGAAALLCPAFAHANACALNAPPTDAREVSRSKFYRIVAYPQWIAADFSGCQRNWVLFHGAPDQEAPRIDTYFEGGAIVRVVSHSHGPAPIVEADCHYEDGFLVNAPPLGAALCPSAKEIAEETKKMRPR